MSYNNIAIPSFKKELKLLSKKYPSLKSDFEAFLDKLQQNPFDGVQLSNNCYKFRIAIKSKNKGKSGGGRIISHIVIEDSIIYLLTIFDKSSKESLNNKELNDLLGLIED